MVVFSVCRPVKFDAGISLLEAVRFSSEQENSCSVLLDTNNQKHYADTGAGDTIELFLPVLSVMELTLSG